MNKLPKKIRNINIPFRMALTKAQEKALDVLWSQAVKARANSKCEKCLRSDLALQAHHVIGRRNKTLRHVVSNGCSLCIKHHFWAEQNGVDFAKWIIEKRGEKWWSDLQAYAREVKVFKEYTIVRKYLESFLD